MGNTRGDLIPIKTFIEQVRDGYFIDYDGLGELCINEEDENGPIVRPSDVLLGLDFSEYNFVRWFNR